MAALSTVSSDLADREAIRELIQQTAVWLDEERFDKWLELFDAGGTYELTAYSPEIRRWMSWWHSDRSALEKMLRDVGQHVRDTARRRHIVGMPAVRLDDAQAHAVSHFSIYRTTAEGRSSLYMVGRYEDRLVRRSGAWLYAAHKVISDTRMLDAFTHIPV